MARWSRRKKVIVGSAAAAAAVAAGVGITLLVRRRAPKVPPVSLGPEASVAPQEGAREPEGGYEARWQARRAEAMSTCQADPEVDTWPQAVSCALNIAFPEAGPWTDPAVWQPWMADAATLVEADLLTEVRPDGTSPTHWEMMLWLRTEREMEACSSSVPMGVPGRQSKIAQCVASEVYPGINWATPNPGWQTDFMTALRQQLPTG